VDKNDAGCPTERRTKVLGQHGVVFTSAHCDGGDRCGVVSSPTGIVIDINPELQALNIPLDVGNVVLRDSQRHIISRESPQPFSN
jgi:hypothetical protein